MDLNDEDDECLMAVAEHIPSLVNLVGGDQFVHTLLLPLESLSTVEETVVRQKAVEGLVKVGERCARASSMEHFCPLVKRLATGEWFTARVSACGLFACALEKVKNGGGEEKKMIEQLRSLFGQLCEDETPMVRRAAATNLGKVAEASVEDKNFINFIEEFPMVRHSVKHIVADVEKACASQKVQFNTHKNMFDNISKNDIEIDEHQFGKKISKYFIRIEFFILDQ